MKHPLSKHVYQWWPIMVTVIFTETGARAERVSINVKTHEMYAELNIVHYAAQGAPKCWIVV